MSDLIKKFFHSKILISSILNKGIIKMKKTINLSSNSSENQKFLIPIYNLMSIQLQV